MFIPLAENNGLIDQLTDVIINKSLQDCHLWEQTGLSLNLSMNLSTTSLIEGDLCNLLIDQCKRWSINPELITLEVTERIRTGSGQVSGGADPAKDAWFWPLHR